ncbi:unnamed protein product [Closterium sp. Yama58-4]|nr:unnamed protein product [Closterium sp. Yama58-4]
MPSTAAVHAPVSHHLGSTLAKQHAPLRGVAIAGSARNMQTVFEDEDNWLLSYLASTSVGKDPRLNAATVKAGSATATPAAAASASSASSASASAVAVEIKPLTAGGDVSTPPLAEAAPLKLSPTRTASASNGATHKQRDTSADNTSITGAAGGASGPTAAAEGPPVTSLAQQQQPLPTTINLPKSQSSAPRFRSLATTADEGTSFGDPDVAAAAAASAAAVSAIAAAVSGATMKSPPESFNDWVAGAGRKYRRHSTAASPSAAPRAGFGAGGASALQGGDLLGQGVAMAADAAAATAAAGRRRRSSVGRVSMSGRRQSMDYSELDAIRERLLHAAHLWAVAAPDEGNESDEEEEDEDAAENVKVDPPMARSGLGLTTATVDKCSGSSKAEAPKTETDKARGEKLVGEAAARGADGGGGSPESAASGALMTRRRAGSVEGIGGSFEDGMGGNGSGSGGGGSGKLLSSQAAMMEANRDPTKSPSSFIKKWMKGQSGLGK